MSNLTFEMAQYKYKCHMYDVYRQSNVEYPAKEKSYKDEKTGAWILCDHTDHYICHVKPSGRVVL